MKKSLRKFIGYCLLFFSIIALDRISKYVLRGSSGPIVLNDYVTFVVHYNRGISWGIFDSNNTLLFWGITAIIAIFVAGFFLYTFVRHSNYYSVFGEVMVCAGALSNIIDRIMYGGVLDFILLSYNSWSWPVFNVADIFIVVGLAIMMVAGYFFHDA